METAFLPDSSLGGPSHEQEARLLVELLRTCRSVVLYAQAGADKTAFLHDALMPRLRRRATDRVVVAPEGGRESAVIVPFPDRRGWRQARSRREIVVFFDDWCETPLAALNARIQLAVAARPAEAPVARLADRLERLARVHEAGFLILLDRFEDFAPLSIEHADMAAAFIDELAEVINRDGLPVNVLIALDDDARPKLADLRSRVAGLDDYSLKLDGRPAPRPADAAPPPQAAAPAASRPAPRVKKARPPPPPPIRTEDVYAFIEATLSHTAESGSDPPMPPMPPMPPSVACEPAPPPAVAVSEAAPPRPKPAGPIGRLLQAWRKSN